jgi:hypothetical protein
VFNEKNHIYYRPFPKLKSNKKMFIIVIIFFSNLELTKSCTNDNELYITLEKTFGLF